MKWLLASCLIIFLGSCTTERRIYSPLPIFNPSLQQKNDFSVSGTFSEPKAYDLNAAFAVTNRIAILLGGYSHKHNEKEYYRTPNRYDSTNLLYRHNGFTLGGGIY